MAAAPRRRITTRQDAMANDSGLTWAPGGRGTHEDPRFVGPPPPSDVNVGL